MERNLRNPTILIVEDHHNVRRSLREWLEEAFPQYHVLEAASGEQAIATAQATAPCLVIMDVGLPGMNGIEATRRIRATMPSTRVVMLSIHEDEAYRADAALAGASAYVLKRRMQGELVPTLTAVLGAAQEAES